MENSHLETFKAAAQGNAQAQSQFGLFHLDGRGVEQDYEVAAHWLEKAAEQGVSEAQVELGVLYTNGSGVEQERPFSGLRQTKSSRRSNGDY